MGGLRSIAECDELIRQHAEGTLKLSPGMGADETLEARLQVCLPSSIRLRSDPHEAVLLRKSCVRCPVVTCSVPFQAYMAICAACCCSKLPLCWQQCRQVSAWMPLENGTEG